MYVERSPVGVWLYIMCVRRGEGEVPVCVCVDLMWGVGVYVCDQGFRVRVPFCRDNPG